MARGGPGHLEKTELPSPRAQLVPKPGTPMLDFSTAHSQTAKRIRAVADSRAAVAVDAAQRPGRIAVADAIRAALAAAALALFGAQGPLHAREARIDTKAAAGVVADAAGAIFGRRAGPTRAARPEQLLRRTKVGLRRYARSWAVAVCQVYR